LPFSIPASVRPVGLPRDEGGDPLLTHDPQTRFVSTKCPTRKIRNIVIIANLTPGECPGFKDHLQNDGELGAETAVKYISIKLP
jgi:hypothetical protein